MGGGGAGGGGVQNICVFQNKFLYLYAVVTSQLGC